MFVESEFSWKFTLEPHQFKGPRQFQKILIRKLLTRYDDTKCTEEHGYFVAVTRIEGVGDGAIREGKGCATFTVCFRGLTFKPITGEIVFGTVSTVSDLGVRADCGPELIAIKDPSGEKTGHMGEYKYHTGENVWKHASDGTQIELGTWIRAKIVKVEWVQDQGTFKVHCSLEGDSLGVVKLRSTTKRSGKQ